MRVNIFIALSLLICCGCARRQAVRPPPVVEAVPSAEAAPAAPPLTLKQRQLVEQLYYQAVSAYLRDDLAGSERHLEDILRLDPGHAPAKELREKIRRAAGFH